MIDLNTSFEYDGLFYLFNNYLELYQKDKRMSS